MAKLTGIKAVLADPKRLAKWKANPGLRRRLPDNMLTPEQRLARRMGQEIFPGAGITGFEQARQAKSATDQVYGPQKLALQEQQNVLGAQRQRNAGWWDQYVGQLRAMQAPQANTIQSPNQLGQYGAAPDAGTQQVQQSAGGYQQALSSLAAGLLQSQVASGGQRKLEALAGLDAQELGVVQKKGALQKEADLYKQDAKGKIAEGARTQYLENIAYLGKKATQDLAAAKLRETIRSNKADESKPPAAKYGPDGIHTVEEWRGASAAQKAAWLKEVGKGPKPKAAPKGSGPKGSSGPKWLPQTDQASAQRGYSAAFTRAKGSKLKNSDQMYRWFLRNPNPKLNIPVVVYRAASEAAKDGFIHRKTAKMLHNAGIKVGQFGVPVR